MTINFDAIRTAHPIASIIGQAIQLTKKGREYHGLCPFHAEKTPSFQVVPEKDFAHCKGCGWHGDVVDFVAAYKGVDPVEAIAMLTGGEIPSGGMDDEERRKILDQREQAERERRIAASNEARLVWENSGPADPHHPYLVRKGIEPHTARATQDGRLVLPVFSSAGTLQSIQTIDDSGGKLFHPGAPMGSGRMHIGINMGRTILCEGFATGASIYEALPDQVCITYSLGNMEKVARELHAAGSSIVLAADVGLAADKMAALGAELGVPVVVPEKNIPDGGNDFNDQAKAFGIDSVAATFREALLAFARTVEIRSAAPEVESGPVDLWQAPPVPELPRGLLPPLIEQFAFESAAQMGTDPAGFAMSALAACAAVLKDDIALQPKQHEKWAESARIWVMLIGTPSTRKTPMVSRTVSRIKKMDADMLREGNRALAEWQEHKSGDRPETPRLRIEDATTEAAQEVCKTSPNGILVLQDELSGFFGRIEKYGGGKGGSADRSFWLQAYGGGQYAVNRVGRGSFLIENLSVTILGGIQPDAIRSVMEHSTDDGLIQRFIPVMLRKAERDRDVETPPVAEQFGDTLAALHEMAAPSNFFGPQRLRFSDEARAVREEMADRHYRIVLGLEEFNPKLSTHIGKYDGLFVRLCVIWHCVENVGGTGDDLPVEVSGDTARRVGEFLSGFIMGHAMAFYHQAVGLTQDDALLQAVGGAILAHAMDRVSHRELTQKVRAFRKAERTEREAVLHTLEAFRWIERADVRADAPSWRVLPEVHEAFAGRAENERVRRAEVREIIAEAASKRG